MTLRPAPPAADPPAGDPRASDPRASDPPADAGARYRLHRLIGRGSTGPVWLAEDEVLQRRVAIKLTGARPAGETSGLRHFTAQARLAAALWHPNLVQIYDFGLTGERAFLVMEYLAAGSLEDHLRSGEMAAEDLRRLACEMLSALGYLHRQDLVHGQLRAGRVLLDAEGRAHLSGFPRAGADAAARADDLFALGRMLAEASHAHDCLSDLIGGLLAPASAAGLRTAEEALESLRVCPDPDGQDTQEFDVLSVLDAGSLGSGRADTGALRRRGRTRAGSRWTRQRVLTAIGRYPVP
ncbi:MAG TPA: protein kinase [Solirubrobacteraceae bacterium]|nr:protein kinase [Solirubrobacteraceae bacterium]